MVQSVKRRRTVFMLPTLFTDGQLHSALEGAFSSVVKGVSICVEWASRAWQVGKSIARWSVPDWLAAVITIPLFCGTLAGAYVYGIARTLPDPTTGILEYPPQSIQVFDRNGGTLYTAFADEDRLLAGHDVIPDIVRHAVVAVEDRRFFERATCVDVRAILRAAVANVQSYKSQGASTITQQLARTVYLSREKLIDRKIRELLLACDIEAAYTKDEILDMYLNWISFGGTVHGITQASHHFFGVEPSQLSVAQAAILASLPQRPTYFSPYGSHRTTSVDPAWLATVSTGSIVSVEDIPEDALIIGLTGTSAIIGGTPLLLGGRAHMAVEMMEQQGFITPEERRTADEELRTMTFLDDRRPIRAPYYALHALDALLPDLTDAKPVLAERGGMRIDTTIDPALQGMVESFVASHASRIKEKYGAMHIAALLTDRRTGEILAYVGNTDFFASASGSRIDMIRSPRQPGSSFKPLVYAYAVEYKGLQPFSVVHDQPLQINGYSPSNYDGQFRGNMSVLNALNQSRNIPAIETYRSIANEDGLLRFTADMGAGTPLLRKQQWQQSGLENDYGWPLAIGAAETPLWEMVEAYGTLANDGMRTPVHGVRSVLSAEGDMLYKAEATPRRVLSANTAHIMTSMLSDGLSKPAGYWRTMMTLPNIDAAVKTGTSNVCVRREATHCADRRPRDVWTIGYTPEYVLGIWAGNADGTALAPTTNGLEAAVPLWRDILIAAHTTATSDSVRFAGDSEPYNRRISRVQEASLSTRRPGLTLRRR